MYTRGDIVDCAYPFSDSAGRKWRPALVVSSNEHNDSHQWCLLAPITSRIPPDLKPGQFVIPDWKRLRLDDASMVEAKIVAVDYGLIRGKRGQFPPRLMRMIDDLLRSMMSL